MKTEPVRVASLIQALIVAVLAVLVAFGVELTDAQTAAVLGVSSALLALVTGAIVRSKVTPSG